MQQLAYQLWRGGWGQKLLACLAAALLVAASVAAQPLPKPMSPPRLVNDFTSLLTEQEQQALEHKLRRYHDSTSTQVYIVTLAATDGYTLAQLSPTLFKEWGIGQAGKNNGVLILIKPKQGREQGDVFIGTGYGMEAALPDAYCKRIVEQVMLPHFRQGAYYVGLEAATGAIMAYASGEYTSDDASKKSGRHVGVLSILAIFVVLLVIFMSERRNGGDKGKGHGSRGSALFFLPFLLSGGHRGGGGWSSGGGGFGGGFSGGGGGLSGGGGAGGKW